MHLSFCRDCRGGLSTQSKRCCLKLVAWLAQLLRKWKKEGKQNIVHTLCLWTEPCWILDCLWWSRNCCQWGCTFSSTISTNITKKSLYIIQAAVDKIRDDQLQGDMKSITSQKYIYKSLNEFKLRHSKNGKNTWVFKVTVSEHTDNVD